MKRICLVINLKKERALEIAGDIEQWFKEHGVAVIQARQDVECSEGGIKSADKNWQGIDMILVLGGDGTLLNTARAVAPMQIPILGINMGHLGFLTEVELADIYTSLGKLAAGDFRLEERMMLSCNLVRDHLKAEEFIALNDVVVTKGAFSRMILFDIFVDQKYVDTYSADGLIISSPTGSTAYSLSAGGPIVSPELQLMLITPICPHTLYSRPMVIGEHNTVRIVIKSEMAEVMLTVDGQYGQKLQKGDEILVKEAAAKTRLVRIRGNSFYDVLRGKMHESGGNNRA